jgi:hypothetical protein
MLRARLKRVGLGDDVAIFQRAPPTWPLTDTDRAVFVHDAPDTSTRTVVILYMGPAHFVSGGLEIQQLNKEVFGCKANQLTLKDFLLEFSATDIAMRSESESCARQPLYRQPGPLRNLFAASRCSAQYRYPENCSILLYANCSAQKG